MEDNKEYYAFISYKREDEKWAKWLQHKLEHYKLPSNLNGRTDLPKNIRPIFRDVSDLTPGLLGEEIDKALHNSQWLIVICSPRSAKSPWVCKEAQTFVDTGRADHIIPFVIEGNPFSNDVETECYPEALLNLIDSKELLAANINEMGRDAAAIKVVARMFGLRFDTLWQRYEKEKRRHRNWIVAAVATFLLTMTGVAGYILLLNKQLNNEKKEAVEARNNAEQERDRAENEKNRANKEKYRAELAEDSIRYQYYVIEKNNKALVLANDSIQLQANTIKKANEELYNQLAKASSREALARLEQCDIIGACHIIDDFIQECDFNNSETKINPYIKQALHIIYDSLNVTGIRTKPIGVFDVQSEVRAIKFSSDGNYIVYATKQGYVSLINIATGFSIEWKKFVFSDITDIDIHSKSNHVAITSENRGNIVCDLKGNTIASFDRTRYSRSIRFSPDGKYLAIAECYGVTIYKTDDYSELLYISYGTMNCDDHIWSIDINDKSELLIATNKECFLYDWKNNRRLKTFNDSRGGRASFSIDYRSVIQCSGYNDYINVYDVNTSENKFSQFIKYDKTDHWMKGDILLYRGYGARLGPLFIDISTKDTILAYTGEGGVSALDMHPKGTYVAVGKYNHKVCVLPIEVYRDSYKGFSNKGSEKITVSPDNNFFANLLSNGGIAIFDVKKIDSAVSFIPQIKGEAICFTPDSKHIICGLKGGVVKEFDLDGNVIRVFQDSLPGTVPESIVISDNFQDVFIADGFSDHIHKFDYKSGKLVKSVNCNTSVHDLKLNHSCTRLISSHASSPNFRIWDTGLNQILSILPNLSEIGNDAVFSPNDKIIAVANHNHFIYVIDLETKETKQLIGHSGASGVSNLSFIDDYTLVSYGSDDILIVWDIGSGLPLHKYKLKKGYATSLTYIPYQQYVIAGSRSGSHIYQIPTTNEILNVLKPFFEKKDSR